MPPRDASLTGAPSWIDLFTSDPDRAQAFYAELFGWTAENAGEEYGGYVNFSEDGHRVAGTHVASDTADFRYTTLGEGESAVAGIMDATSMLSEGAPAAWSIYFAVGDTDAALAEVIALGGSVDQPAVDTPFGRLAQAADPAGAPFKLVAR